MKFRNLEEAVFQGQGMSDAVLFASQPGHVNDLYDDHQGNRISLLHYFVMTREKRGVDLMLARGADADTRDGSGMTALWAAVFNDDAEMVRTLAKAGANLNATEPRNGDTPLHAALTTDKEAAAKLLVELGADPDIKNRHDITARALHGFNLIKSHRAEAASDLSEEELRDMASLYLGVSQTPEAAAQMSPERRNFFGEVRKEFEQAMKAPPEVRAQKLKLLAAALAAGITS